MNMNTSATTEGFRSDINGLRAWAVTAVVLFHFRIPGFTGGFAGVDIFFVISGYLMASIVIRGIAEKRFGLIGFYLARARRIMPALIALVVTLLLIGALILAPSDYQQLGRHAKESLLFTSNLRFLAEAGYFDTASHEKWLLHTWSLSVEWQFYLLYPLILIGLWRLTPGMRPLLYWHAFALFVSLALSTFWTYNKPEHAFYLLPSRAWELLAGGMAYLIGTTNNRDGTAKHFLAMELSGLALIAGSILFITSEAPWPGMLAVLPTLGAVLILLAARQNSVFTANLPAQWLGTRSYSLYLWHWPLAVGLTYFGKLGDPGWIITAMGATLFLGELSYRWVENPARRMLARRKPLRALLWLLAITLPLILVAQQIRRTGIPQRLPAAVAVVEAQQHDKNPRQDECLNAKARCVFGGPEIVAIVAGDSHADSIVTAVADSLPDQQRQGVAFLATSGCLLVEGANWVLPGGLSACDDLRHTVFTELDSKHPGIPLILINRTTAYAMGDAYRSTSSTPGSPMVYFSRKKTQVDAEFQAEFRQHYIDSVCHLTQKREVFILLPVPDLPVEVPKAMARAMMQGKDIEVNGSRGHYHARNDFVRDVMQEAAEHCGAKLLDPVPYLCDANSCYGAREGIPLYVDDDHLSMHGNRLLLPLFAQIFTPPAEPH